MVNTSTLVCRPRPSSIFCRTSRGSSGGPEGTDGLDESGASVSMLGSCFFGSVRPAPVEPTTTPRDVELHCYVTENYFTFPAGTNGAPGLALSALRMLHHCWMIERNCCTV